MNKSNAMLKQINDITAGWDKIGQDLKVSIPHEKLKQINTQLSRLEIHNNFESIFKNKKLFETISSVSAQIGKTSKLFETYNALQNSNIFKVSDLITKSLENIALNQNSFLNTYDFSQWSNLAKAIESNFSNFSIDYETIKEIEEQEIVLNDEENQVFKDIIETLLELFPPLKLFFESLEAKKYHNAILISVIVCFDAYITLSPFFQSNDFSYKINRDNVRIRETPSNENDKNIIYKLGNNISVVKVDSKNGWVKVRFELEDGVQKEGWVYGNMVSKVE
jgi:hypothetical protein